MVPVDLHVAPRRRVVSIFATMVFSIVARIASRTRSVSLMRSFSVRPSCRTQKLVQVWILSCKGFDSRISGVFSRPKLACPISHASKLFSKPPFRLPVPKGAGSATVYETIKFPDGSTIMLKGQSALSGTAGGTTSSEGTREIIKGTGRFEGIKGTGSSKNRFLRAEKREAGSKQYGEGTITYTLPPK